MKTFIGILAIASQAMVLLAFLSQLHRDPKDKLFTLWTLIVFMTIVVLIDWIKIK